MSKAIFYECVRDCDLPVWAAPSRMQRQRMADEDNAPLEIMHSLRVYAKTDPDGMGRSSMKHGQIIKVPKPLGKQYTEVIRKKVSRPIISLREGGRTLRRAMREKVSKVKFRKLEPDEVTRYVEEVALCPGELRIGQDRPFMGARAHWGDEMFKDVLGPVQLPEDTQKMLASVQAMYDGTAEGSLDSQGQEGA